MSMTPAERSMRSELGAQAQWAQCDDRTAAARAGFNKRFENQVDPEGILPPEERAKRAQHAQKAHMLRLAMASAKARRLRAQVADIDAELANEDPKIADEAIRMGEQAGGQDGAA